LTTTAVWCAKHGVRNAARNRSWYTAERILIALPSKLS
jgi:hypothetical protein